jgi:Pyruvate/2-oxoacid:ferredoxin oxidoreductase delta subunit
MKRKIINIDREKCNGCGLCIPNCPEGAIQMIDGKARLISDLFCDGLGACLGHCPEGAIVIEEREAEPYDERRVMENIVKQGPNTIKAHLHHLKEHNETVYHKEALAFLKEKGIAPPAEKESACRPSAGSGGGCPGSRSVSFAGEKSAASPVGDVPSALTHWPIQLHLISPAAPQYREADVLLAADCTAFSAGNFHARFLKGKSLIIACPKLDEGQDVYLAKLKSLIEDAKINTLTVLVMQVPCCGGLIRLAQKAVQEAGRKIPVKTVVVSLQGEILQENWI